jgi:hypothetical protein
MKSIFMKLFIIGLCVSFFPIQAIAEGKTGEFAIDWVHQRQCRPSQGFEIQLSAGHANPDGCADARVLELSCDELWYLPSVAVFLTAFSLGATVDIFVNGCDSEGQAIVKAVMMFPPAP